MEQVSQVEVNKLLHLALPWEELGNDRLAIEQLEKQMLPAYVKSCRWFAGKARRITAVCLDSLLTITAPTIVSTSATVFHLLIIKAKYRTGKLEQYLLPLALVQANPADEINLKGIIGAVRFNETDMILIDAIYDEAFRKMLFHHVYHSSKIKQTNGSLFFVKGKAFQEADFSESISSRVLDADQSNSSLIFGEKYFMKLYRKLFRETNPDVEVVSFLTEKAGYSHIPAFAGTFGWKKAYSDPITFGMMQEKVESIKDAWSLVGDYLNEYIFGVVDGNNTINQFVLDHVGLLATRTAEMHLGLGCDPNDPAFTPEPFTDEYRDWLFAHFESLLKRRIQLAKENFNALDEKGKALAEFFMQHADTIRNFFSRIKTQPVHSLRTRIHGDYHLGQVLYNGSDYIILDFEGEPESSISDRKIKHSPLKDVAGMLRSFHYAVSAKLYFSAETKNMDDELIENAAQHWYKVISETYLHQYFETVNEGTLIAADKNEQAFLLQIHLLEKAIYELGYEFNGRPTWVKIPLKGIQQVVNEIT
ncbi:MAG: putative maltokinase [Chitinophagaceae bacterium]|nr:putative maltokinase [Chitinophagaceae bacterium]